MEAQTDSTVEKQQQGMRKSGGKGCACLARDVRLESPILRDEGGRKSREAANLKENVAKYIETEGVL